MAKKKGATKGTKIKKTSVKRKGTTTTENKKEIDTLKKQLRDITSKYLKKRKKEAKTPNDYKKVRENIVKRTKGAKTSKDIASLIAMLKQGVGMGRAPAGQPIIQQTPATMGTISTRVTADKKKTPAQDPLKLWRELKNNWTSIKEKYNNDTLSRDDLVNMWNKAKKLGTAVQDNSLLLVSEIIAMYGVGKSAYEYIMRFINKHKPLTENAVSLTDPPPTGPTPPPSGGDPPPYDDTPPPPYTERRDDTSGSVPAGMDDKRGDGLGKFSDARAEDTPPPPYPQSWGDYLKDKFTSGMTNSLATAGALGLGYGSAYALGRLRGGQRAQERAMEPRQDAMAGIAQEGLGQVLAQMEGNLGAIEGIMNRVGFGGEERRLRQRGRDQDQAGRVGQLQQEQQAMMEGQPRPIPDAEGIQAQIGGMLRPQGEDIRLPSRMMPSTALSLGRLGGGGARPITRQMGMAEGGSETSMDTIRRLRQELAEMRSGGSDPDEIREMARQVAEMERVMPQTEAPETPMAERLAQVEP